MMLKITLLAFLVVIVAGDTDHICYKAIEGEQPHGATWIWEPSKGRFKECVCPNNLPDEYDHWSMADFCHGICFVGGAKYRNKTSDTWTEFNDVGTTMNCKCLQSGNKECYPSCLWLGVEHKPNEVWVQDVSKGRTKECRCPEEFPDGVIDWRPEYFCKGRCIMDGDVKLEGESQTKQRKSGVLVECTCQRTSNWKCT